MVLNEHGSTSMPVMDEQGPGWQSTGTPNSFYRLTCDSCVSSKESLHREGEKPINGSSAMSFHSVKMAEDLELIQWVEDSRYLKVLCYDIILLACCQV